MEKKIIIDGREISGDVKQEGTTFEVQLKGQKFCFESLVRQGDLFLVKEKNSHRRAVYLTRTPQGKILVDLQGRTFSLEEALGKIVRQKDVDGRPRAPMPGKIMKIFKTAGDLVKRGDPLIIMEAMKMEHTIKAGRDGKIKEILCAPGDLVAGGMDLLSFVED